MDMPLVKQGLQVFNDLGTTSVVEDKQVVGSGCSVRDDTSQTEFQHIEAMRVVTKLVRDEHRHTDGDPRRPIVAVLTLRWAYAYSHLVDHRFIGFAILLNWQGRRQNQPRGFWADSLAIQRAFSN